MPRAKISSVERRKAEVAGGVVLMVLQALPESGTAELLRELIDMTLVDADDRALLISSAVERRSAGSAGQRVRRSAAGTDLVFVSPSIFAAR